ncbi:MAG: hypothetical protein KIT69_21185, partial [Propionibacteriaceae bacterium]|nr:hypothetical protein [Propionibacteriaceae bacterium]
PKPVLAPCPTVVPVQPGISASHDHTLRTAQRSFRRRRDLRSGPGVAEIPAFAGMTVKAGRHLGL